MAGSIPRPPARRAAPSPDRARSPYPDRPSAPCPDCVAWAGPGIQPQAARRTAPGAATTDPALAAHSATPLLLQADGNAPWPLADDAVVILGRVQRQDDSVAAMMQREMQRLLRQHGFHSRGGGQHQRQLLAAYRQHGATVLEPVSAARWTVTRTPWQSIA